MFKIMSFDHFGDNTDTKMDRKDKLPVINEVRSSQPIQSITLNLYNVFMTDM